jgi:allantoin racemase
VKILLINPNTSAFVTEAVAEAARRVAAPGTEILPVTGTRGAPIIGGRAEDAIGTTTALELAAEHAGGCDAVLLAVSFDSGLRPLRELLSIPVVGMSESAMLTACLLGGRFSLLTFGGRAGPLYEELVRSYGLDTRFAGMLAIPPLTREELESPASVIPRIAEEIEGAGQRLGAEVVVLAGAVFAGLAGEIMAQVTVPVVDGVASGVTMAESLVRLGHRKPTSGSYRLPDRKELRGVAPALNALYKKLPS